MLMPDFQIAAAYLGRTFKIYIKEKRTINRNLFHTVTVSKKLNVIQVMYFTGRK